MPSIILTNTAPACTREDGLPNAVGRGGWFIDVQQGSLRQLKRSDMSARRHHWREGVACNLCTRRDPSPSLQSKLHQYPTRTLNQNHPAPAINDPHE